MRDIEKLQLPFTHMYGFMDIYYLEYEFQTMTLTSVCAFIVVGVFSVYYYFIIHVSILSEIFLC